MTPQEFKELRKKAKLTQEQLAQLMGVHRETIINIEKGETTIKKPVAEMLRALTKTKESGIVRHSSEPEVAYGNKRPYTSADLNVIHLGTSATVSASLELLCELFSVVSNEPLSSVQARAKVIMQTKAKKVESFLDAVF
jgi:DNA-binding XRE family transcriptional regulator